MLKSLLSRNIALLVVVVVAGQVLSIILVGLLLVRPQTLRLATIMAQTVKAIAATMEAVPADRRAELIARINAGHAIRLVPGNVAPPEDRAIPTLLEATFMRAFAREMRSADVIIWRGGHAGQLWARVHLAGQPYWFSYERPKGTTPTGALAASALAAVVLALVAGIIMQRRLSRPLQSLADAADAMRGSLVPHPLATNGPREIAAVAESFNRMTQRLAAHDAERTFMLAGISHDLRTPLTKIRLAVSMLPQVDATLEAVLNRQLDHMDEMLSQFLDFGRGIDNEAPRYGKLREVIDQAVAALDAEVDVVCDNDIMLSARPLALQRALINMLRNALIHGAPPVSIEVTKDHEQVAILVTDNGPGVDPEQLQTLDQPFVRGDHARGGSSGTGLGLAIVRHIAMAHGGRLHLANRSGGGFVATLILPVRR